MRDFFSIGEVAKYTGLSRQALIFYDKIGLFRPAYVDPQNGYRSYSAKQIDYLDTILIMKKIGRSKLGFALRTIREDEDAAAAIGINPTKYKVIAVVISAIIAGLVGFFYVSYIRYIDPDVMIQSKSTEIVLPAVVGGAAYIEGPLIGGLIMIPLSELLRANFAAVLPGINMLMYAVVLIVVIRFRPSGILGWYMNSKVKTFIDEKILKKPSLDVLEEYELMADKGGK